MKTFKDNKDRTWVLDVNIDSVKHVRATLAIDLLSIVDGKLVQRFLDDPIALVDTVWVLVQDSADKLQITERDFAQAMGGDALGEATEALMEEIANFFRPGRRKAIHAALAKIRTVETQSLERATRKMEALTLDQIEAMMPPPSPTLQLSGNSSHVSPDSPDLTPVLSHSAT